MPRPGAVYRGKRKYGWLMTLALFVLIFALMAGLWVFNDLQKYIYYEKDGLRLVLEGDELTDDAAAQEPEEDDSTLVAPPVTDAQVVVELPDFSGMSSMIKGGLSNIKALYVSGDKMTAQNLAYYPTVIEASEIKYNCLVLDIKGADGMLDYFSTVPLTASYGVNGTESLKDSLTLLKESGLWLVAEVSSLADSAMAVRNSPLALRSANGGILATEEASWLDPFNPEVRGYIADLMAELKAMGFDEVLLTNLCLPADMEIHYSQDMSAMPDPVSSVSSFAKYLRSEADELDLRLSACLKGESLRNADSGRAIGQDAALFFKVFDRVYVESEIDQYAADIQLAAELKEEDGQIVTTVSGFNPTADSFFVR